jgi:hormone-sensitive lipase
MQSYTRKWANNLKVPIFSIDYGKPPEHRYPIPVFDCLDVYSFITDNIHKYMNIKPSRIILAGDSAGGNLVCSLNALIMRENLHPV